MPRLRVVLSAAAILATALTAMPFGAFAGQLITDDEAKLPAQKGAVANSGRGITRGPKILVPDGEAALQASPIRLQIKFQTFGGSSVDLEALKVTYLKSPVVDLTSRIKPFVLPTGIDMPDAQLPPGDHLLRVDIKDSDGRPASVSFLLKISP
jgi:hypothetical protein